MDKETRGQAESAYIGLKDINYTDGIYIFNIDTIRHDYTKPDFINNCDGYLEVFEGRVNIGHLYSQIRMEMFLALLKK